MAIEVPDWYRTVALVGVDITGEPVVVLLDSTGAIIAVMKGEYAGTLKNVKVDSEGRMIMIPTDPADVWGNAISMGNAELAACLGAAKRFDRRGDVIWIDSFESGLAHINPQASSAPISAVLSSKRTRTSGFSAKWVLGPLATDFGSIYKAFPYSGPSRIGSEISFTCPDNLEFLYIEVGFNTPTTSRVFAVEYDNVNNELGYKDTGGAYQTFETSIDLSSDEYLFHTAKLVINMSTDKYTRFLLDDKVTALPAVATKVATGTYQAAIWLRVRGYPVATQTPTVYLDDWISTENEPA